MSNSTGFNGNQNLKKSGEEIEWTRELLREFVKCSTDAIHFCNYINIVSVDDGVIKFEPYEFQKRFIRSYAENRFTVGLCGRQMGKTTVLTAIILHYILFNDNKTVVVLANKGNTSKEILRRIKLAYEHLPKWLQHGVIEWNKESFELENGSRVVAGTTTSDSIRGLSASLILIDEAAHIDPSLWEEFYSATMPVLSSGKETKMFLISTPNGMNHFYRIYKDAEDKVNNYKPVKAVWRDIPWRDDVWYDNEIKLLGMRKFMQEHEVQFLGSSLTLVPPDVLQNIRTEKPVNGDDFFRVFDYPEEEHVYVLIADPSEGVGGDDSAISVIDISVTPFKQVAAFSDNSQNPIQFANTIDQIGRNYNDAYVMVESNNYAGGQITQVLEHDLEYPMLLKTTPKGAMAGFGVGGTQVGIRTTQATKGLGCAMTKIVLEKQILQLCDEETINQFSTFAVSKNSKKGYEAQKGCKDDLVMTIVIFGWMTDQPFFKDLTDQNIRATIRGDYANENPLNNTGMVLMQPTQTDDFGWGFKENVENYDEHMDTIKWMIGR